MPVSFLTAEPRDRDGRYASTPSPNDLSRYFHLDDADLASISHRRGDHSRLGFALQLTTVRFLGTFLDDPVTVPHPVIQTRAKQLDIGEWDCLLAYRDNRRRWAHTVEIRSHYGYREFVDPSAGFRLARWLYALCWTGTERPSVLFDRAMAWLLTHKILFPGVSVLERFVARWRSRVEVRLWHVLGRGVTLAQQAHLESLLTVPDGSHTSRLDQLRTGPVTVSGPALVQTSPQHC